MDDRLAVKISVSLPEDLKLELERYAAEHGLSVSATVQQALEGFFHPAPDPEPDPSPTPPPTTTEIDLLAGMVNGLHREVHELKQYILALSHQSEHHRQCLSLLQPFVAMSGLCLPVAPPLPPPPVG